MGKIIIVCLFLFFIIMRGGAIEAHSFKVGEKLSYKVKFLGFVVGEQTLEVKNGVEINGYPTYLFLSATKTVGLVSLLYRLDSRTECFADLKTLYPRRLIIHRYENSDSNETRVEVNLNEKLAIARIKDINYTWSRNFSLPILDAVSLTYWLRTQDLEVGKEFSASFIEGQKIRELKVKVVKEEEVWTYTGSYFTFLCSEASSKERKMWFTTDKRHLPVKLQAETSIGILTAYLSEIEQDSLSSGSP
ncbi:MAG: DUF3108 domain-containing protein [Candidatus Aerophobetes bacterium]|nr:DUF3108 domain-containing protein [Candidatus Aerophobetes bacterium]